MMVRQRPENAATIKRKSALGTGKWSGWLLFFYSVPSRPVSNRMKVWRRLARAGAVLLKGAVYVLPNTDENHELFQWLVSEVSSMGGEAAFTQVAAVDSMDDGEIIALFAARREADYQNLHRVLDDLETRVNSIRKGSRPQDIRGLSERISKVSRNLEDIQKTDFFGSGGDRAIRRRIDSLAAGLRGLSGTVPVRRRQVVPRKRIEDHRGLVWVSRKRPFVDRMASAWLIRRFIDKGAVFSLRDERDMSGPGKGEVRFDVSGGEFTHLDDLCTFEVMVKSFGLKDKTVRKIAEIVHELDIKDDKHRNPEARGVEEILLGLRRSEQDDNQLLEKGISVFEMLYRSKSG